MNKEYVDEDELAKKIVFDRTLRFVNNLYGDEPEVSLQQDQKKNLPPECSTATTPCLKISKVPSIKC